MYCKGFKCMSRLQTITAFLNHINGPWQYIAVYQICQYDIFYSTMPLKECPSTCIYVLFAYAYALYVDRSTIRQVPVQASYQRTEISYYNKYAYIISCSYLI